MRWRGEVNEVGRGEGGSKEVGEVGGVRKRWEG